MDVTTVELAELLAKAVPSFTPGPNVGDQAADLFRLGSVRSWRTQLHQLLSATPWEADSLALELQNGTSTRALAEAILRHYQRLGRMPRQTMRLLTDIIEMRDPAAVQQLDELVGIGPVEQAAMQQVISEVFANSARQTAVQAQQRARALPRGKTLTQRLRFDLTNDAAIEHAQRQAGSLVSRINEQSRRTVAAAVHQAVQGALTPAQAARVIRGRVGLLPAHAVAVQRVQDTALKATGSPAAAQRAAAAAEKRLRNWRVNTIARTEVLDAQNAGQLALWKHKVNTHQLPGQLQKMWIIARDERTCPRCSQMMGERAIVPMDGGMFLAPGGRRGTEIYIERPPMHPNCRCAVGLWIPDFLTPGMQQAILTGDPSYADNEPPPVTQLAPHTMSVPQDEELTKAFEAIRKFNPNHSKEDGRFTSGYSTNSKPRADQYDEYDLQVTPSIRQNSLKNVLDQWTASGPRTYQIHSAASEMLEGSKPKGKWARSAKIMLDKIANDPDQVDVPLYRGMGMTSAQLKVLQGEFKEHGSSDVALASFSKGTDVIKTFAGYGDEGDIPVFLVLPKGAQGIDANKALEDDRFHGREAEVVVGGRLALRRTMKAKSGKLADIKAWWKKTGMPGPMPWPEHWMDGTVLSMKHPPVYIEVEQIARFQTNGDLIEKARQFRSGALDKALQQEALRHQVTKFNPNHEPAGSDKGGQFASYHGSTHQRAVAQPSVNENGLGTAQENFDRLTEGGWKTAAVRKKAVAISAKQWQRFGSGGIANDAHNLLSGQQGGGLWSHAPILLRAIAMSKKRHGALWRGMRIKADQLDQILTEAKSGIDLPLASFTPSSGYARKFVTDEEMVGTGGGDSSRMQGDTPVMFYIEGARGIETGAAMRAGGEQSQYKGESSEVIVSGRYKLKAHYPPGSEMPWYIKEAHTKATQDHMHIIELEAVGVFDPRNGQLLEPDAVVKSRAQCYRAGLVTRKLMGGFEPDTEA